MKPGADLDRLLSRALAAKLETRCALARLPYEEKLRRLLQMQANAAAIREAREARPAQIVGPAGKVPPAG